MSGYRLYIFDKDGTICQSKSGQKFINNAEDQELIPDVLDIVNLIAGKVAIASNQGGVAFGYMTYGEASKIMQSAANLIDADYYEFCHYHPDATDKRYKVNSFNRKPNPGMIFNLIYQHNRQHPHNTIKDCDDVLFIGDRWEDQEAARRSGVDFMWASEFFCRPDPDFDPDRHMWERIDRDLFGDK